MNKLVKLLACLSTLPYASSLIRRGVAAAVEHGPVLHCLDCQTVIDIGAHSGQFALIARHCFPQSRIISFEPQPRPAARYASVFARDSRTTLHRVAVGPGTGYGTMHVSRRDDSSSLLPITARQSMLFPGTAETSLIEIRVGPLDEFVSVDDIVAPALLKLDVQGFELLALQGCEPLLTHFSYIYVECSFVELYASQALVDEVIAWLRERGFRLVGTYNIVYDRNGRSIQGDFLFQSGLGAACTGRST